MKIEILGAESVHETRALLEDLKVLAGKHNIVIMFKQERTSRGREYLPEGFFDGYEPPDVISFSSRPVSDSELLTFKVIKNS